MSPRSRVVPVVLESGRRKVFAAALDWPGWCRAGRGEEDALEALATYATRYAEVAERAGLSFSSYPRFDVVERLPGGATTDFGAPEAVAEAERARVTPAVGRRLAALVTAAWAVLDEVAATSPAELRKGPRGGGRDRDKMIDHVLSAEAAYARKLGIRHRPPALDDPVAIEAMREEIAAVLAASSDGAPPVANGWPARYGARRIAWHALDHAWEMQDRAGPA
jgi:hypothetical protein